MLTRPRPATGDVLRRAAEPVDGGLDVLMAGGGQSALASADPRPVALTGERAARNDRTPDSWEHLMPYGVRVHDQHLLPAAGHRVRVVVGARR